MVQVTDQALDQLEAIKEQNSLSDDQGITLVPQENGQLAFAATTAGPDDETIERDGRVVMVIPQPLIEPLSQIVIDYVDTPEVQGFTLEQTA